MRHPATDDARLAARAGRRVALVMVGVNAGGGCLAFLYLAVLPTALAEARGETVVGFHDVSMVLVVFGAVVTPLAIVVGARLIVPALAWLIEGREATGAERRAVLRQPLRQSMASLCWWVAAAVVFTLHNIVQDTEAIVTLRVTLSLLLSGLTTGLVGYLAVERVFRPLVARVLAGTDVVEVAAMRLRPRFLLTWLLGSAVPLLGIVTAPVGRTAQERADLYPLIVFLGVVGLVTGAVLTGGVARSVGDPIGQVRAALDRVRNGDLDAEVRVDSSTEIGLLQSGFNRMVAGLRERERLAEVFGRYVGPEVARRALERGVALGGEQRDVSVLFVDVIESTKLAEQHEPHEVVAVLNRLFAAVVTIAQAEGGRVDKFEGDGALIVFGAPEPHPDHATAALRAARAMCKAVEVDVGIGVSTGTVVAGNVGAEQRFEYTVIGDPVNEAARLTEAAKDHPARVLAAARAVAAASPDERRHWDDAGELSLRGRSAPTAACAPVAAT